MTTWTIVGEGDYLINGAEMLGGIEGADYIYHTFHQTNSDIDQSQNYQEKQIDLPPQNGDVIIKVKWKPDSD